VTTDAGATLTTIVGVLLARLALQGTFRRYVKPGMGPWLAVAGIALALLGLAVLWRHRRGDDDHSAHEHGHVHGGEPVAWLLLAPVLVLLLVAPAPLGAFSLDRTGSAASVKSGGGVYAPLDPASAPHQMTLLEFDQRAFEGTNGASFAGVPVQVVGFVAPAKGDGFLLARYSIACCAADALAATAHVVGWDGPAPARDTWVEVVGTFQNGDAINPRLVATSVAPIPTPDDPYESA
jgi:uncharacterized repeat protein (TIGR03943 family)